MKQGLWAEQPTASRAILITGGSEASRQEKVSELRQAEVFFMVGDYRDKENKERVIIFANNHEIFQNMTFQKAKKLAGTRQLGADFCTTRSAELGIFGIITLPDEPSFPTPYRYKKEESDTNTERSGFCLTM